MYSTVDIASFLGIERPNINYYIKKGYLKATMIDDEYSIKKEDYHDFLDNYYNTDKRFKNRGPSKKLTDAQIIMLGAVLKDLQNVNISLAKFKARYENKSELIPNIKDFIIYKRDKCILFENKDKGKRQQFLADKYNLRLETINRIINQDKEKLDY